MASPAKPAVISTPLGLRTSTNKNVKITKGLIQQIGPLILPAPAALHADFDGTAGIIDETTGFSAMPLPGRCVRIVITGMSAVAGICYVYGTRLGVNVTREIAVTGAGTFDDTIALDTITRFRTSVKIDGTISLKTGLGFGLPNAADDATEFAVSGVRATPDVDWPTGTVRLTSGQIPDGTKTYQINYLPRYE